MAKLRKLAGETVDEIAAIQRVLKDHIKDSTVRHVVAHSCVAAAKAARIAFFEENLRRGKNGDNDNGT
ncbi:MAG TPA: hypothetical protein VGJ00_04140 [Rhabdochlamydiaceae bacterium]|jgi:hypothetical protein